MKYDIENIIAAAKKQKSQKVFYPSDTNIILVYKSADPMYFGNIPANIKIENLIESGQKLFADGVNLCRTLDYRLDKPTVDTGYFLQDRAPGLSFEDLLDKSKSDSLKALSIEPLSVYEKYITDWIEIHKEIGYIDYAPKNIFYSQKEHKITFIDLTWREHKFFIQPAATFQELSYYANTMDVFNKYIDNILTNFLTANRNIVKKLNKIKTI
ncbi:MAG: hypothetical protein JW974_03870 [Alphaproteobacteria bacterium]|nr:hypothetical protein [Alphaproteobacteria bacterium]MBN2675125.1 hypothetical protein [Alphaproteobacteria bacterium]